MKKAIYLFIAAVLGISMLAALTSCSDDNRPINVYSDGSSAPLGSGETINIILNGGTGINPTENTKFEDIIATPHLMITFIRLTLQRRKKPKEQHTQSG